MWKLKNKYLKNYVNVNNYEFWPTLTIKYLLKSEKYIINNGKITVLMDLKQQH